MAIGEQCVACADYQSSDPAPVPTTGSCTKVQCDATVQFAVGMETQHATILWVNEDAAMSFRDIQGELDHLLSRHSVRRTLHNVRDVRRVLWLGITVLEVTSLMELSTTSRGDLPSAMTTPSFPTAVR